MPGPERNGRRRNTHVRFTSNVLRSIGMVSDALCFIIAFPVTILTYRLIIGYYFDYRLHMSAAIVMGINYFLIRVSRDGYTARSQSEDSGRSAIIDFAVAATLTSLMIWQFDMLPDFSRGLGLLYVLTCMSFLFLSTVGLRKLIWELMKAGHIGQRVAVYGADRKINAQVLQLLEIERLPHIRVIGFADDRKTRVDRDEIGEVRFLGGFPELLALAQAGELDQVMIALPQVSQERLNDIADQLSAAAIDVCIIPREFLELRVRYHLSFVGTLPVLSVWQQPIRDLNGVFKTLQDWVLALGGLILLSPLLALTALAIKLESRGPVLFAQSRFGFNNLEIKVLKFRSMYIDRQDVSGAARTERYDPRVTRVGRIIRRLSIDELPQLINVLRGEMSIVGPRPHATQMRVGDAYYFDAVKGYAARHRVRPGITGLAQVRGLRGEIDTIERARKRVEYDVYYIENWSPLLDLRIIVETVAKLFWDRHAY